MSGSWQAAFTSPAFLTIAGLGGLGAIGAIVYNFTSKKAWPSVPEPTKPAAYDEENDQHVLLDTGDATAPAAAAPQSFSGDTGAAYMADDDAASTGGKRRRRRRHRRRGGKHTRRTRRRRHSAAA